VTSVFDGVLALTEGVPQLDGLISGTRDDLSVVGRESDREDVLGVSDETAGGGAVVQVPQTEGTVPRSREGELTVGGDNEVLDEVVVSGEGLSGDSVLFTSGDVPHHERLVSGTGEEDLRVLGEGGNGGDPSIVTLEGTSLNKNSVGHLLSL